MPFGLEVLFLAHDEKVLNGGEVEKVGLMFRQLPTLEFKPQCEGQEWC